MSFLFEQVPFKAFLPFLLFGLLFLIFLSIKIIPEVREDGVYVRSYPQYHSFRFIPFKNIQSYEVRNLSRTRDRDRLGFRYGLNGDTYNLSASRGVSIEFMVGRNKSRVIIGSNFPNELVDAIRRSIEKQTPS